MQRWRALNPAKSLEQNRKWREENLEKARAACRNYLANLSFEKKEALKAYYKAYGARYYQDNKERVDAHKIEYRARNPEKVREWRKRREALLGLRREPTLKKHLLPVSAAEAKHQLMQQNKAFAAASSHVPRNLPQDMRDDIISDIVVACLESKIRGEDVKKSVPRFIAAHSRDEPRAL